MNRYLLFVLAIAFISCNSAKEKKEPKKVDKTYSSFSDSLLDKTTWELRDYVAVADYLKEMKQENVAVLKRFVQREGKLLFEKLIDRNKYAGLLTGSKEKNRLVVSEMPDLCRELFKLFLDTGKEDGKYVLGYEIIQSFMASLHLTRLMLTEADKLTPDKEAWTDVQKNGWNKLTSGSFQMIRAALITIERDHTLYEKKDIIDLSRFLPSHIQKMSSILDDGMLEQLDAAVEKVKKSDAPEEVKQAFEE